MMNKKLINDHPRFNRLLCSINECEHLYNADLALDVDWPSVEEAAVPAYGVSQRRATNNVSLKRYPRSISLPL